MPGIKHGCPRNRMVFRGLFLVMCFVAPALTQIVTHAQRPNPAPSPSSPPASSEEEALRAVVERYFATYGRKDLAGVVALWSENSPNLAAFKQKLQQQFTNEDLSFGSPVISRVKIENERAGLRVTIPQVSINLKSRERSERPSIRNFELAKEAGAWKVWRSVPAAEELAEALVKAGNPAERAALLAEDRELMTAELSEALLTQGQLLVDQGTYDQAREILGLALEVAERSNDESHKAEAIDNIGHVYRSQGNYSQALVQYRKSLKISEAIGNRLAVARTLNAIGVVYWGQGDYTLALEYYQKSLKISEEIGNQPRMARALGNIGNLYQDQGDYSQALEQYQKILKIFEDLNDEANIAGTLGNMGSVYALQGNYAKALEQFQKGLKISEKIGDKPVIANTLTSIGSVHYHQNNYAQALEQYQKSLKLNEEIGNRATIVITLCNIGNVHAAQGRYAPALEQYQQSLKISQEIGDEAAIAEALGNIGHLHQLQGHYAPALEFYQKSLKIDEGIGNQAGLAGTLRSIGESYELQGNHLEALRFAERAIDLASQTDRREVLWSAYYTAGRASLALNQLDRARQSFDAAIRTIEAIRTQVVGGEQEQQRFFESKVNPYQAMVELLIAQQQPGEALGYAERARARVLLDVFSGGRLNLTKAMTGPEIEQERQLNNQLVSLNIQYSREKQNPQDGQNRSNQLETQLQKARLDLEAFRTNLYAAHPELKIQRSEIRPASLEDAASLIPDPKTALLDFMVTDEKVHLFVLTGGTSGRAVLNTYPLQVERKTLAEQVGQFRSRLANKDFGYRKLARGLYELLLKPAEKQLQGKTNLIISPDQVLWDLPFQVLQPREGRYLIEDAAISYAPSLTVLREMQSLPRKKDAPAGVSILALGNPELGGKSVELVKIAIMDANLQPLPEAAKQVEALGQLYGPAHSRIYKGSEAREEVVKQESAGVRILHLATHGILNDASPMYSHVMLSQAPGKSSEDGLLEAREIMNLDLNADLVVLSACETARGRIGTGEGVIGLTWALFVAGCPRTVVSQWKVESSSTTALMIEFHKRFKTRFESAQLATSTAEAMRQASLKVMKEPQYRHPFYWGGFVVVGDGR
ncbi:MAG TPA: tetratricopeptide repeat protein [Blastocatellia bacterium]|nr:tetratricopeptide repeat protein [Blastocatellia bacterium]